MRFKIKKRAFLGTGLIVCCLLIIGGAAAAPAPSAEPLQSSWLIVPRVRVGAITRSTSEAELKRIYGRRNVRSTRVSIGEGEYEPGTRIFPDDPLKSIEIIWKDARRRRFPRRIQLTGERSVWRTLEGITLGTRLKELERINGKPFVLAGFSWDYEGTVLSWEHGKLEQAFEKNGRVVILRLSDRTDHGLSDEETSTVLGDNDFSSGNQVMQKINPKVYQIIIEFP